MHPNFRQDLNQEEEEKVFVDPETLMEGSVVLSRRILDDSFFHQGGTASQNHLMGIWRGGTHPAIYVHEFLTYAGLQIQPHVIKTELYEGVWETKSHVSISGLKGVIEKTESGDRLLIVDDVWDSGLTMDAVLKGIQDQVGDDFLRIRTAVVFFKPERTKVEIVPDYKVYETDRWISFPHELEGLTKDEIQEFKPPIFFDALFSEKFDEDKYVDGLDPIADNTDR